LYKGSSDLFNFKPHKIDLCEYYSLRPRLAIQLSKEQVPHTI